MTEKKESGAIITTPTPSPKYPLCCRRNGNADCQYMIWTSVDSPTYCTRALHSAAGDAVLDQIEKIVSGRIAELKSWIKLAQINQDRKRELEILPILGENQALWAQIQELRQQGERGR